MHPFLEQLAQPKPLLLDGATGTELERRGVAMPAPLWSAAGLLHAPEVVVQVHQDYVTAGADMITTNTFRTHARNAGNPETARQLTIQAVELAQQAVRSVGRQVWIAGSIAPLEDCYSPHLTPDPSTCQREHTAMVQNLVDGGADLLLIETMHTRYEAEAAAQAAQQSGLPFLMSFILNQEYQLLSGESLADTVEAISHYQPAALLINCIPTRHMTPALHQLQKLTDLPVGAYGNMSTPMEVSGWAAEQSFSPGDYCDYAAEWLSAGAKIIGSCCGSHPDHTAALRHLIDTAV